ncbi:hypothetical protein QNE49_003077 [Vibrio fluvialis]|uniref:hypothetical protein n=1 Tax=Vibrio TaxID=662 RepID=UPI00186A4B80|nr:hypothetical protein [Vibrio parahaemolyticus]ELO4020872.1 hypothetical protein [Vibrio fluvialis]ELV8555412.1 hypothetical protein [Vibrio fluvialis]MBE4138677.1 hypothetical protein [Vibrio parahaemolyticus]MCG0035560.1 hypothetical protein [Vibrio parahaemolyticus]MCX8946490.1 hypothetical protein [Vibrio parahaemolyticus]
MSSGVTAVGSADGTMNDSVVSTVNLFFSDSAIWLVPLLLVLIQFCFKLFIAEKASIHQVWKNFLQSPVDVGFLALSFSASLMITNPTNSGAIFGSALAFILVLVISVVIWKCSPTHTTKGSIAASSALVVINFIITGMMLVYSISMMVGAS